MDRSDEVKAPGSNSAQPPDRNASQGEAPKVPEITGECKITATGVGHQEVPDSTDELKRENTLSSQYFGDGLASMLVTSAKIGSSLDLGTNAVLDSIRTVAESQKLLGDSIRGTVARLAPWQTFDNAVIAPAGAPRTNTTQRIEKIEEQMGSVDNRLSTQITQLRKDIAGVQEYIKRVEEQSNNLNRQTLETSSLLNSYVQKLEKAEERMASGERRSIEVVGLVSSMIALVLVSATAALSQQNPLFIFLLILLLTASLMLFACMLHVFFQPDTRRDRSTYWTPFFVVPLVIMTIVGVTLLILGITGYFRIVP